MTHDEVKAILLKSHPRLKLMPSLLESLTLIGMDPPDTWPKFESIEINLALEAVRKATQERSLS